MSFVPWPLCVTGWRMAAASAAARAERGRVVGNSNDLYGGAALVTGASSGLGEAFARKLASLGLDLILVARREERLNQLAEELKANHGIRTLVVVQDLVAPDAVSAVESQIQDAGWEVGLLVNNAGFGSYGAFEDLEEASETRMVELNSRVPVALTRRFVPGMVARGRGGVIIVASMAGYQPVPYLATYGATKAFDLSFAEALWAELKPQGVDVLALCPGYVDTGFQAVAGVEDMPVHGAVLTPDAVVECAMDALGSKPSVVPGVRNKVLSFMPRVLPRAFVARAAANVYRPKEGKSAGGVQQHGGVTPASGRFQKDLGRMLLVFFAAVLIDLVVISLMTGKFRFWFPNWIDPAWETRADAWVIYSQSYIAGILLIPFMLHAVDRSFLAHRLAGAWRGLVWAIGLGAFVFVLWWKGNLMADHGKEKEALGWVGLTGILWVFVWTAEAWPKKLGSMTSRAVLRTLLMGISAFFLVMAVLDPVFQVAVQELPWSSGLIIEVSFFIPAGLTLAYIARRLGKRTTD
jgi:short-subunit dehydrogenase